MLNKWIKELSPKESLFIKKNGKKYQIILRLLEDPKGDETVDHIISVGDKETCERIFSFIAAIAELITIVDY